MTKVSLSALRAKFIAHMEGKTVDMETIEFSHIDGEGCAVYTVRGKSLKEATGLEKLGNGCYADVYAIDDKRVLKVVKDGDDGYKRFVNEVVRKLPGNKYLPRVFYQGTWAGKEVYILERLEETNGGCYSTLPEYQALPTWGEREAWEEANADLVSQMTAKRRMRQNMNSAFRTALEKADRMDTPFMQIDPDLLAVAKLLKNSHCHNDIHAGNVMFRGDIPVVTDPST